jgi:hypothetical protein
MTVPFVADSEPLPAPWEFWTPKEGRTITLNVVRFESGTVVRDIREPPYAVLKLALRTYVPPEEKPGRPPYWDWTAKGLIQRILALYRQAFETALTLPTEQLLAQLEAISPARPRPLPLLVTRRVHAGETEYAVELGALT